MESFGDMKSLKQSISRDFDRDIKEIQKQSTEEINQIERAAKDRAKKINAKADVRIKKESRQIQARILSEERLKAKKDFETAREQVINKVLDGVLKKTHSKEYLDYLKKKTKGLKGMSVVADSNYYNPVFKKLKTDKNITGVKLVSGEVTYDFTLTSLIESNKVKLRAEASKVLFGGKK